MDLWAFPPLASAAQIQWAQTLPKDQECERVLSVDRMKNYSAMCIDVV